MYELVKEWEQDGFELRAYTMPDEAGLTPEDMEQGPMPEDTPEWIAAWNSRLNQFYGGAWYYVGVIVEARMQDVTLGGASLWGIESDATEYHKQVADELADEALEQARDTLEDILARYQLAT